MPLSKIRLELARCPEFPNGSQNHGYEFFAPLTPDGHLDAETWRRERAKCTVRRFWAGEPDEAGHLVHTKGRVWAFHYDDTEIDDDEPIFQLDNHVVAPGEYLSITEQDGERRTFLVSEVR